MTVTTCTLLADGTSDRVLIPFLEMLLDQHCPGPYRLLFAEALGPGLHTLATRIEQALRLFPCDLMFVHRDAEGEDLLVRAREIDAARATADSHGQIGCIHVIPVRMTESWLLVDEQAIRSASGNPNGVMPLALPRIDRIESLPDPKQILFDALRTACGLSAQRRRRFSPDQVRHRVSELLTQTERLRRLASFQHLERQIEQRFQS